MIKVSLLPEYSKAVESSGEGWGFPDYGDWLAQLLSYWCFYLATDSSPLPAVDTSPQNAVCSAKRNNYAKYHWKCYKDENVTLIAWEKDDKHAFMYCT